MIDYAKVGYVRRVAALVHASFMFPWVIFKFANRMLKEDGYSFWDRVKLNLKGIHWLVKPGGFLAPTHKHYIKYYKPGYHPWQEVDQPGYEEWLAGFNRHRDPVEASELMRASMVR